MDSPSNPFPVLPPRDWKVGDRRRVPARALEALLGTDAYDSYEQVYELEGLKWRVESRLREADGTEYTLLVCVDE